MHGHVAANEWADITPRALHVHGKFSDVEERGDEPAIDYGARVAPFVRGGCRGYVSREWEGHAVADLNLVDPLLLVREQYDLIRALMRQLVTR